MMGSLARLWPIAKIAARTPSVWSALIALIVGSWIAHGVGHDAGYVAGVEVGMGAERTRQANAALDGTRTAIRDREEAEDEAADEWVRAGGDLERLCETDPACRDRHGVRLDEENHLVAPGHARDGEAGARAQRGAGEALPAGRGDER